MSKAPEENEDQRESADVVIDYEEAETPTVGEIASQPDEHANGHATPPKRSRDLEESDASVVAEGDPLSKYRLLICMCLALSATDDRLPIRRIQKAEIRRVYGLNYFSLMVPTCTLSSLSPRLLPLDPSIRSLLPAAHVVFPY